MLNYATTTLSPEPTLTDLSAYVYGLPKGTSPLSLRNPPRPHNRPKRLLPLLPLPTTPFPPPLPRPLRLPTNIRLKLNPHKNRNLQQIIILIQHIFLLPLPLSRRPPTTRHAPQKPGHNLNNDARPVPPFVPYFSGLDLAVADAPAAFRVQTGAAAGSDAAGECVVPDVRVGTDVELWAEDRDAGLDAAGGDARGGEGDADGVEEGVGDVEEEMCREAGFYRVVGECWCLGGCGGSCWLDLGRRERRGCRVWGQVADTEARDVV